jgi:hypothetical protein
MLDWLGSLGLKKELSRLKLIIGLRDALIHAKNVVGVTSDNQILKIRNLVITP